MSGPILIVEDEIFVAMDIERVLDEGGYRVAAIAADQREALNAADDVKLAFVDLNLRDGPTGPKIANILADRGVKVIYITANPAQIEPVASTAIGYIRKPFSEPGILSAAALAFGTANIAADEVVRF
ncbi:MAG: response regulator [Sphingomonadaceae bacterium]